jgi:hypothetical protein
VSDLAAHRAAHRRRHHELEAAELRLEREADPRAGAVGRQLVPALWAHRARRGAEADEPVGLVLGRLDVVVLGVGEEREDLGRCALDREAVVPQHELGALAQVVELHGDERLAPVGQAQRHV